jgi:hypothetical protein
MTATDFNNLPSTYTLSCGGCRAGILYVEGSGSDKVIFKNSFTTGGSPVLIVTALPVVVSSGVGIPPIPATGMYNFPISTSPNIEAAIVSADNITIESKGASSENYYAPGPVVFK